MRWANHVTADEKVGVPWRYLLKSEADVSTGRGSWGARRRLGNGSTHFAGEPTWLRDFLWRFPQAITDTTRGRISHPHYRQLRGSTT
jgi:hypothetical protein